MGNTKLTDAQRVILAAAGARESGLVLPTPKSVASNSGTLGVLLKSLLTRALIAERPVNPGEEKWRETPELGRTTLVISDEGLKAIGIEPESNEGSALPDSASLTLGIPQTAPQPTVQRGPRADSKLGAMIGALRQPDGATISDLTGVTGWQKHSVRGTMSGSEAPNTADFSITVPLQTARRGPQMKLVVGGTGQPAKLDPSLVTAIVRARDWADRLICGEVATMAEICAEEGLSDSYVGRLLPLAFCHRTLSKPFWPEDSLPG